MGGELNDIGWSIQKTSGGYIIAGTTYSFGGGSDGDVYLVKIGSQSGIREEEEAGAILISSAESNPFLNSINLEYEIPENIDVKITIYDMLGRKIRKLYSGIKPAGVHKINWDGSDDQNGKVPGGIYLLKIETEKYTATEKITLIR